MTPHFVTGTVEAEGDVRLDVTCPYPAGMVARPCKLVATDCYDGVCGHELPEHHDVEIVDGEHCAVRHYLTDGGAESIEWPGGTLLPFHADVQWANDGEYIRLTPWRGA